ncbi:MAG: DUF2029 domain-containing protein [Chloroflexota bacterium]
MKISRPDINSLLLILLGIVLLSGLTWANYRYASESPGGNDFVPRWIGTRMFVMERVSPYSDQASEAIQDFMYGRPARGAEDRALFVYPHYSMLVFAPISLVADFPLARSLWMTALEVALAGVVFLSISLARWRPTLPVFAVLLIFTFTGYHSVRPIINGNVAVLVALFITLAMYNIFKNQDVYAAVLLALATVKPQMVVLILPFVIYWGLSMRRWKLAVGTVVGVFILSAASMMVEVDWIIQNIRQILIYPEYSPAGTPRAIFEIWWPGIGDQLGKGLSIFLGILLVWEWLVVWGKGSRWFLWTASLTLVVTNLIGIPTATANYVALFPALILVFSLVEQRWGRSGNRINTAVMIGLLVGLWILFVNTIQPGMGGQPVQGGIMFFPLPLLLLFGLYWVRWWAIKPRRGESAA